MNLNELAVKLSTNRAKDKHLDALDARITVAALGQTFRELGPTGAVMLFWKIYTKAGK